MVRIELGCGATKCEGYIGVDRFELPGVDIVADLNAVFPFEDDTVDEIWACHSLEHLDNISHTFSEMYRICKHGSIIQILAPYYFTTLNISNFYHKSVWTEDTPRLFDIWSTEQIQKEEYIMPHGIEWGVGRSDNSDLKTIFQIVKEEFFYFPEYCHLSDELKRQARRSMLNVCDQVYYVLVVNKSFKPFSKQELDEILKNVNKIEPSRIKQIRERDRENANKSFDSIYDRITSCEGIFPVQKKIFDDLNEKIGKQEQRIIEQERKILEQEKKISRMLVYRNLSYDDVTFAIKKFDENFYDGIQLNNDYQEIQKIVFSDKLSAEKYLEFSVPIAYSKLKICLYSDWDSGVFFELVQDGRIIKQEIKEIDGLQMVVLENAVVSKKAFLRIRLAAAGIESNVKVLLVKCKNKEQLAYVAEF